MFVDDAVTESRTRFHHHSIEEDRPFNDSSISDANVARQDRISYDTTADDRSRADDGVL